MTATRDDRITAEPDPNFRLGVFTEELIVDVAVTAAIVWGLVLLGEPLGHVLRSPLFIILTVAGLTHLTVKAVRRPKPSGATAPQ